MSLTCSISDVYFFITFFQGESTNTHLHFGRRITGFDVGYQYSMVNFSFVRSDITVLRIRGTVSWNETFCSLVDEYQCFELHVPWRWKQEVPPKVDISPPNCTVSHCRWPQSKYNFMYLILTKGMNKLVGYLRMWSNIFLCKEWENQKMLKSCSFGVWFHVVW